MGGRLGVLDIRPRAGAGVDEASFDEPRQSLPIEVGAFRLDERLIPVESQPLQVLNRQMCRARLVTRMVKVLHAHDNASADGSRPKPCDHERAHIAKVQSPRRTRCEPAYISFQYFAHSAMNRSTFSGDPKAASVAARISRVSKRDLR